MSSFRQSWFPKVVTTQYLLVAHYGEAGLNMYTGLRDGAKEICDLKKKKITKSEAASTLWKMTL